MSFFVAIEVVFNDVLSAEIRKDLYCFNTVVAGTLSRFEVFCEDRPVHRTSSIELSCVLIFL